MAFPKRGQEVVYSLALKTKDKPLPYPKRKPFPLKEVTYMNLPKDHEDALYQDLEINISKYPKIENFYPPNKEQSPLSAFFPWSFSVKDGTLHSIYYKNTPFST